MALFIKREEPRSQLQDKIAADLKNKPKTVDVKTDETDPAILENSHQARPVGMIIMLLLFLAIVVAVVVVFTLK